MPRVTNSERWRAIPSDDEVSDGPSRDDLVTAAAATMGAVTGAAGGAVLGGPPGAIVGAAAGTVRGVVAKKIVDHVREERDD